jgi:hypothetical protein
MDLRADFETCLEVNKRLVETNVTNCREVLRWKGLAFQLVKAIGIEFEGQSEEELVSEALDRVNSFKIVAE